MKLGARQADFELASGVGQLHCSPRDCFSAASLPTLLVELACHGRSSKHVGKNEMGLLTGGEQANVFRGDDIEVRPTVCIVSPLFEIRCLE